MELKFGKGGMGGARMFSGEINPHDIFNMLFGEGGGGLGGLGGLGGILHSLGGMGMGGMGGFGGEIHIIHQSGHPADIFRGGIGGPGGGFNPFIMHMQHQQPQQQQQQEHRTRTKPAEVPLPDPIEKSLKVTMEQAYTGFETTIEYEKVISENEMFSNVVHESMNVVVPKGVRNGEVIILPNVGNVNVNGVVGEIKLTIQVQPHSVFSTMDLEPLLCKYVKTSTNSLDLVLHKTITLKESLCGFQFEFTHLNGKTYQILNKNIGSVIQPESTKTIKGLGFERMSGKHNSEPVCGSLHIWFHVTYPETLTEDVQTALSSIL
jgi:DnaJ-class molecular chaperone